jgi:hypothetical protein
MVTLLAAAGAGLGAFLILANGGYCSDGVSESFCGRRFLGWRLSSAVAVAYAVALGAVVGALAGFLLDLVFRTAEGRTSAS